MKTARLAVTLAIMLAQIVDAAEIRVLALPAMHAVMEELAPQYEVATGHKLSMRFALPSQSRDVLESGAFDLVAMSPGTIDNLIKQSKIISVTRVDIARVPIGVAVRSGAPRPDISTVEAFKRTLLNASSISYTRDSGTGIYLASLMERLGIADEMRAKTKLMGGGGQNPKAVAGGDVELGISVVSDIFTVAGVELLGLLPPETQQYAVVTVGVGTTARDPAAAQSLIRFITAPAAVSIFKAKGMEPIFQ